MYTWLLQINVPSLENVLGTSSITYVYWCTVSVPNGDYKADDVSLDDGSNDNGNEIVKHWRSLMDHLCNIHDNTVVVMRSTLLGRVTHFRES